jgi:hypothetical protein
MLSAFSMEEIIGFSNRQECSNRGIGVCIFIDGKSFLLSLS